mgnify:CR=1 FL=1
MPITQILGHFRRKITYFCDCNSQKNAVCAIVSVIFTDCSTQKIMKSIVKIVSAIGIIGAVIWFGGTIIRYAIAYDVFIPGTLVQKPDFTPEMLAHTVRIYTLTAFYTLFGYGATVLGIVVYAAQSYSMFRQKGWMFMVLLLFILAMPAEIYLLLTDIDLVRALQSSADTTLSAPTMIKIFLSRFSPDSIANQASTLTIFAYLTGLILLVFKPLDSQSVTQ